MTAIATFNPPLNADFQGVPVIVLAVSLEDGRTDFLIEQANDGVQWVPAHLLDNFTGAD